MKTAFYLVIYDIPIKGVTLMKWKHVRSISNDKVTYCSRVTYLFYWFYQKII